jgi:hypothetical protein
MLQYDLLIVPYTIEFLSSSSLVTTLYLCFSFIPFCKLIFFYILQKPTLKSKVRWHGVFGGTDALIVV